MRNKKNWTFVFFLIIYPGLHIVLLAPSFPSWIRKWRSSVTIRNQNHDLNQLNLIAKSKIKHYTLSTWIKNNKYYIRIYKVSKHIYLLAFTPFVLVEFFHCWTLLPPRKTCVYATTSFKFGSGSHFEKVTPTTVVYKRSTAR